MRRKWWKLWRGISSSGTVASLPVDRRRLISLADRRVAEPTPFQGIDLRDD
jgi:hypothetical protein